MAELVRLAEALGEVTGVLGRLSVPYMVIGGVANLVWGEPRTTQDVDITVEIPDERVEEIIRTLGEQFSIFPNDPGAFLGETQVLPMATKSGVRIDLIRAGLPYEIEAIRRAQEQVLGGVSVKVASPEDLIPHKLASKRPRDLEDVAGVIRRQWASLDRAYLDAGVQGLAETLEDPNILETYRRQIQQSR